MLSLVATAAVQAGASISTTYQVDPAHDGSVTFPTRFTPPLKKLWSVDLGGYVSYPVVSGNLVIVTAGSSYGIRMAALDVKTGKPVWQKLISAFETAYLATDGAELFLTTESGPIQAFQASTGRVLWARQPPNEAEFDYIPIASDGYLYTAGTGAEFEVLYRIKETTGAIVWRDNIEGGIGATLGDGKIYFPVPCDLPAYSPANGKLIWNYSDGCRGGGGHVAAYYRGNVYAPHLKINLTDGVILNSGTGKPVGTLPGDLPAFYGKVRYGISGKILTASSTDTGAVKWRFTAKDDFRAPPIAINGNVYTKSVNGTLYIHNGSTGKMLQSYALGFGKDATESGGSGMGVGPGVLLVPSGSVLAAFAP